MQPKPLCILVTGDPVSPTQARVGGFARLVRSALGSAWQGEVEEIDARSGSELPSFAGYSGIVITGSASSVTERADWILRTEEYLAEAVGAAHPVLGICFGHQLLGQALGGLVERNPRGREMGTVPLELVESDPILDPSFRPALAHTTHVDSVTRLPPGARVLARTEREPHAAVRFGRLAWGVQFHPEFDTQVMQEYLTTRREVLENEGFDAQRMLDAVREAESGRAVLPRFVEYAVLGRSGRD
jgi:GMP synthase (glutamine-hydrolysing)